MSLWNSRTERHKYMSYAHGSEAPRLNHSNIDTIFQRIFKVFSCEKQNYESKISSWKRILMVQFCSTTNPQVPGLAHNFCWKIFWKNLTKNLTPIYSKKIANQNSDCGWVADNVAFFKENFGSLLLCCSDFWRLLQDKSTSFLS